MSAAPEQLQLRPPGELRIGRFHRGAGSTEIAGALKVLGRKGTQRRRIVDALLQAGNRGLTHWEITELLGTPLQHSSFGARMSELADDGWIVKTDRERVEPTGSPAKVWVLTERAIEQLVVPA